MEKNNKKKMDMDIENNNIVMYMIVGIAAISMGVSIYLYREVKYIKLKENTNQETLKSLDDKMNQLGKMLIKSQIKIQEPIVQEPIVQENVKDPVVLERSKVCELPTLNEESESSDSEYEEATPVLKRKKVLQI